MDLKSVLQSVTQRGRVGADGRRDSVLALLNTNEENKLARAGGANKIMPGTDGLVHQFFNEHTEGGQADSRGAAALGGGGGGKTNGSAGGPAAAPQRVVAPQAPGGSVAAAAANGDASAGTMQATQANASLGRVFASNDANRLSPNLNNPETQNALRSGTNYTGPGATPYVSDPSLGQLLGTIFSTVPVAGTLNNLGGAALDAYTGDNPSGVYNGGFLGSAIDKYRGVSPGQVTGASNPDANSGFRATKGEFSSSGAYNPNGWLTNSPLMQALVSPKIYSSTDATIVR